MSQTRSEPTLTFLFPCLNEAETVGACVTEVKDAFQRLGIDGEILVADNGSTDGSPDIATRAGARVIVVAEAFPAVQHRGYGTGLLAGLDAARSEFVVFADSDGSYDVSNLGAYVEALRGGADLVMGNRFRGGIEPGAMPPLHRWIGNPGLTLLGRVFFGAPVGDVNCGMRGCRRTAMLDLGLRSMGMEFAIEMVAKASLEKLRIAEVPTVLRPDGRSRKPHLRTFHDGWRQLRFMLLFSPRWLFLYPGMTAFVAGAVLMTVLTFGPLHVFGAVLDVHSMLVAMAGIVVGSQTVLSFLLAYQYATSEGVLPASPRFDAFLAAQTLERTVALGGLLFALGVAGVVASIFIWANTHFGDLDVTRMMRIVIPSVSAIIMGFQLIGAGFVSGTLKLEGRPR